MTPSFWGNVTFFRIGVNRTYHKRHALRRVERGRDKTDITNTIATLALLMGAALETSFSTGSNKEVFFYRCNQRFGRLVRLYAQRGGLLTEPRLCCTRFQATIFSYICFHV